MSRKKRVYLVSLGCPKNLVDTEHMLGLLVREGYEPSTTVESADLALVNTCAFIEDAVKESIDTILELADLRARGAISCLVVTGCLVQRYGYKLSKNIPEVDLWLGTGEVGSVVDCLKRSGKKVYLSKPSSLPGIDSPRVRCTPFYTAYLRIAEGCSHRCSFCLIPKLRGPLRSRTIESILFEAKQLAEQGVRELNIIAQDITAYGRDLGMKWGLESLVEKLASVEGIQWIRLLYAHPNGVSERLLRIMETVDKVCPYLDIPFQHVNKKLLAAMGRQGDEEPKRLVERIEACSREIAIRTTLMVGFPGEGEREFKELREFVQWAELDHVGVFVFSKENGTRAQRLDGEVSKKVAEERKEEIMRLQSEISFKKNQEKVGACLPVLIEGISDETDLLLKGRTQQMAPEIDGQVLINRGQGREGAIMPVRITEAYHYDLVGEIVG
ncbi:MAG: 30S ribosomal protein S12 methylthiotransferase RimO [Deltaproteobacteria bacterium]|nr:MAG: 30S ribosomal protein S12 methylthiotransferase RimO [Deltaproteobacteria bacterium]